MTTPNEQKPTWAEILSVGKCDWDYWTTIEGQIESSRFRSDLHRFEVERGESTPLFPSHEELTARGFDPELLARHLYDGLSAEDFGHAVSQGLEGKWFTSVLKAYSTAEANTWLARKYPRN